jgi:hypothetical protein
MKDNLLPIHARREKSRFRYGQAYKGEAANGFVCAACHAFVCTESGLSCVQNRNHCPYCLWSRHLDLYAAGDRLSACKSLMQPIGLTIKRTFKKYGPGYSELMLVHACRGCEALSINRIAADDNPQAILTAFEYLFQIEKGVLGRLKAGGIQLLDVTEKSLVLRQLFGNETCLAETLFQYSVIETAV